jgi:periplasmic copper chaperone A
MTRLLLTLAIIVAGITAGQAQAPAPLNVEDGWVYAPLAGRSMTGGFGMLVNQADAPIRIVAARSKVARVVELHEMAHEGGMMRMRKLDYVEIPAKASRPLRPGSDHLMLIDIGEPLIVGSLVDVVFLLEDGRENTARFEVRAREGVR